MMINKDNHMLSCFQDVPPSVAKVIGKMMEEIQVRSWVVFHGN